MLSWMMACEGPEITQGGSGNAVVYEHGEAASATPHAQLGEAGQQCHWDGSCDDGFVCLGVCQARQPTPGVLAGPCRPDGGCDAGLECRAGEVCADPVALAEVYDQWVLSEEEFSDQAELLELGQELNWSEWKSLFTVPDKHALKNFLPPVGNQGSQGSCVPWAVGYGMRGYQAAEQRGYWSASTEHLMSPTYLYSQLPKSEPCRGTSASKAIGILQDRGIAPMSVLPYIGLKAACNAPISEAAHRAAASYKSGAEFKLFNHWDDLRASTGKEDVMTRLDFFTLKWMLSMDRPVVVIIKTYPEFGKIGSNVWRDIGTFDPDAQHGYHAVLAVGYDDDTEQVTIMNSWSPTWGDRGYGYIHYDVFKKITGLATWAPPLKSNMEPPPGPWAYCGAARNLTCSEDDSELIETCGDQEVRRIACEQGQRCIERDLLTGRTGCFSEEELLASCGDQVSASCRPATAGSAAQIEESCYDRVVRRTSCAPDQLCTTRSGAATCEEKATLERECSGGMETSCHVEEDRTFIAQSCEGEVLYKESCSSSTTCYDLHHTTPSCQTPEQLAVLCELDYGTQCTVDAMTGASRVAEVCEGNVLRVLDHCDDFDMECQETSNQTARCEDPSSSPLLEVRLEWHGAHDLDLFVIEPDGNEISYSHTDGGAGGGVYDADESCLPSSMACNDTTLYIERVVWDQMAMPASGRYQVQFANGRADVAVGATLVILRGGVERLRQEVTTPSRKGQRSAPVAVSY